jgi:hypothetical protein
MPQGITATQDADMLVAEVPELVKCSEPPPPSLPEPPFGDDGDDRDDQPEPPINNARLGLMLFIGAEGMFLPVFSVSWCFVLAAPYGHPLSNHAYLSA